MEIHLTAEQAQRIQALLAVRAYQSMEEFLDAALAAVEQRTLPGFVGTEEELDSLLAEGMDSQNITEDEFWTSVNTQTDALLEEHRVGLHS